jgi:hypothetical protein
MQQLIATASGGDIRLWNLHSLSFEGGVIGHQVCTTLVTVPLTLPLLLLLVVLLSILVVYVLLLH